MYMCVLHRGRSFFIVLVTCVVLGSVTNLLMSRVTGVHTTLPALWLVRGSMGAPLQ